MILIFPDIDTLRLAMMAGHIPNELLPTPARISRDPRGRLFVETDRKLARPVLAELSKLGVAGGKRHGFDPVEVSCWSEIIPLVATRDSLTLSSQTPILFDVPNSELLSGLVSEMLRLGNDRQSYRWAPSPSANRTLLRVIGPPYYTLLRAIDRTTPGLIAYYEQSPRIWIAIGYKHPCGPLLQQAEGRLAFLRFGEPWEYLPDEPFHDIYEILRFELPNPPQQVQPVPEPESFDVPLRLIPSTTAELANLWVIHSSAKTVLDSFVRDADERIIRRLKFSVGTTDDGHEVTVLRALPSKQPPPILTFPNAVGFRAYRKLPNLYIPVDRHLYPALRRDAVRQLLAEDTDRVVWLYPESDGSFVPESLAEDSFRPLGDWVEYTIDNHRQPLAEWVASSQFDFDAFVCAEHPSQRSKEGKHTTRTGRTVHPNAKTPSGQDEVLPQKQQTKSDLAPVDVSTSRFQESRRKSDWEQHRADLERQFLDIDGELDHPKRQAIWAELAQVNAALNDLSDAAICYSHAIWHDGPDRPRLLRDWANAESTVPLNQWLNAVSEIRLNATEPAPSQVRELAAIFLALSEEFHGRQQISARLVEFRIFFERHERSLPNRIAWLVSIRLAEISGADPLGLARARDRMLQRLLENGMNAERDLPVFLRTEGIKDSEQVRRVRRSVIELQSRVHAWTESGLASMPGPRDGGATVAYADLLFAYGMAKLGEQNRARELVRSATEVLTAIPGTEAQIVAGFLLRAYQFRIEQVIHGHPTISSFPPEILAELETIQAKGELTRQDNNSTYNLPNYVISRLREQSRILEPHESFDPYAVLKTLAHDLEKSLTRLQRERDPIVIARTLRDLYAKGSVGRSLAECRFLVLLEGIPLTARVGSDFAVEMLEHVGSVIGIPAPGVKLSLDHTKKQGQLLERSLIIAAHFDRRDVVRQFSNLLVELVRALPVDHRFELVNGVTRSALRSLRKMGLRDEMDRLLQHLRNELLRGETLSQAKARYALKPIEWNKALQSLLHLAGGWHALGLTQQAQPILDEARSELYAKAPLKLSPLEFTKLTQAYLAAVALGPVEQGLERMEELFHQVPSSRYSATFTTAPFYSRLHLNVVEEVVLSLISDGFSLGQAGQRWLDEDEYLIRRRIHSDVKMLIDIGGV